MKRSVKGNGLLILGLIFMTSWTEAEVDIDVCDPDTIKPQAGKGHAMPEFETAFEAAVLISDPATSNSSQEQVFGTDGEHAYMTILQDNAVISLIGDYQRGQVIELTTLSMSSGVTTCTPLSLEAAAENAEWIFGYNKTINPHPDDPAWALLFKDFDEQFTGNDKTIMGIPCLEWQSCKEVEIRGGEKITIGMKFYWSDPAKWTPAVGSDSNNVAYSVPVRIEERRRKDGVVVTKQSNFFHYSIPGPSDDAYKIPDDVLCEGLSSDNDFTTIPYEPRYYSYESEIIVRKNFFEEVVLYQKHFVDTQMNITRLEFEPNLDGKPTPSNADQPDKTGKVTIIHDNNLGLSYVLDKNYGTCEVGRIDETNEDLMIEVSTQTEVLLTNVLDYLMKSNIEYTYYQEQTERGIPANLYVGFKSQFPTETIYKFWFSQPYQEIEGQGMWTTQKPIKAAIYPRDNPTSTQHAVDINIFNFDVDRPEVLEYDITSCPTKEEGYILRFALDGFYNPDIPGEPKLIDFKHQVLATLLMTMYVSPLRIHNMQIDTERNPDKTIITFNLLGLPQAKENVVPKYPDVSAKDALDKLRTAIDNKQLYVAVGGPVEYFQAFTESLEIIPKGIPSIKTTKASVTTTGWSGGAVAGLSIGMIVVGLILGAGILYVVMRKRPFTWPPAFEHTRFVNKPEESTEAHA